MYHHEIVDLSEDAFLFKLILHSNSKYVPFISKHWHRSFEVSFTYRGSIDSFSINQTTFTTREGDILLINPNVIHAIDVSKRHNREDIALTILFPSDFMKQHVPQFENRFFLQPNEQQQTTSKKKALITCQHYLTVIVEALLEPDEFSQLIINGSIFNFLYEITKEFSVIEKTPHTWPSQSAFQQMSDIINYIDSHFKEPLSIYELAKTFNLSEGYFSRLFKKHMNMSVMFYVDEIRLRNAYQLLLNTPLSITIISDQSGFPNVKSFNRVFTNKYGETPTKYRRLSQ